MGDGPKRRDNGKGGSVFLGKKNLPGWVCTRAGCGFDDNFGNRMVCLKCPAKAPLAVRQRAEASVRQPGERRAGRREGVSYAQAAKTGTSDKRAQQQLNDALAKLKESEKERAQLRKELREASMPDEEEEEASPHEHFKDTSVKLRKKVAELERAKADLQKAEDGLEKAQERHNKAQERVGQLSVEVETLRSETNAATFKVNPGADKPSSFESLILQLNALHSAAVASDPKMVEILQQFKQPCERLDGIAAKLQQEQEEAAEAAKALAKGANAGSPKPEDGEGTEQVEDEEMGEACEKAFVEAGIELDGPAKAKFLEAVQAAGEKAAKRMRPNP